MIAEDVVHDEDVVLESCPVPLVGAIVQFINSTSFSFHFLSATLFHVFNV